MRGRNSSKYYRRSSNKKRKVRNVIIISVCCLFLLFLLFVIVGNLLSKKATDEKKYDPKEQTTASVETNTPVVYSLQAYPIDVTKTDDVSSKIKSFVNSGANAVSLKLTDANGDLLVRSELAISMGNQSDTVSLKGISYFTSRAKYYDMLSSAVLDLNFFNQKDAKYRAVMLAYEAALACEMYEKGADEVIVRVPNVNEEQIQWLIDFANSVKSINSAVILGVALPTDSFYQENSAENIAKLSENFDVLGIDLSVVPKNTKDTLEYVDTTFSEADIKYYVLRYNMRVLLPYVSEEQDDDLKIILSENSIENWQKIS